MSLDIYIGGNDATRVHLIGKTANRHGMIAGATGTGKTVTLQVLAEGFSRLGVPVFLADVKGDLSGIAAAGEPNEKIGARIEKLGLDDYENRGCPAVFWDIFRKQGHPLRATTSGLGPLLLSNLLELNEVQTGVLYSVFSFADDSGWYLDDFKDLRIMLQWVSDHAKDLASKYGNITTASVGAIQRRLLVLEEQGAEKFFGMPGLDINDLMRTEGGRGLVNVMDVTDLLNKSPKLYATFLFWLLSELYESLPEVGDLDVPKMVLFFDEAHLLFNNAPKVLVDKVEQVVRLIRSKGVGIYFVSQSPLDIPMSILGQLGLRVQHALRAFTPKDKATVKSVAQNFRPNPALNTETVITQLGIGEALVSVLDAKGVPSMVEQVFICPPESRIGPLSDAERQRIMASSMLGRAYAQDEDRESAYEIVQKLNEEEAKLKVEAEAEKTRLAEEKAQAQAERAKAREPDSFATSVVKSVVRSVTGTVGRQIANQIVRGVLGSILKK